MSARKQRVLFVANRAYGLTSSRVGLIREFQREGYDVVAAVSNDGEQDSLRKLGVFVETINFERGRLAILSDVIALFKYFLVYVKYRPILVHNFHAKPVIIGGLISRFLVFGGPTFIHTITGLGNAFVSNHSLARIAGLFYRICISRSSRVIFQNKDDLSFFLKNGWCSEEQSRLVVGSGIDLKKFSIKNVSGNRKKVVMLGRMVKPKGVLDFIKVAQLVRENNAEFDFLWAGEEDSDHPDAIDKSVFDSDCCATFLGRISDVSGLLESTRVLLFTSYREGFPRSVMEAQCMGVPVVAYDVEGVRDSIKHGETGYLAPFGSTTSLAYYVGRLLRDEDLWAKMSAKAVTYARERFDISNVQKEYFEIYKSAGFSFANKADAKI